MPARVQGSPRHYYRQPAPLLQAAHTTITRPGLRRHVHHASTLADGAACRVPVHRHARAVTRARARKPRAGTTARTRATGTATPTKRVLQPFFEGCPARNYTLLDSTTGTAGHIVQQVGRGRRLPPDRRVRWSKKGVGESCGA